MVMRFGVLTTSDRSSRGERMDETSPAIIKEIEEAGWQIIRSAIVPDDFFIIKETLKTWVLIGDMDVILTTGGTGCSPRDITPEATLEVVQRLVPGLSEAMRSQSMLINKHAMLSRGIAGISETVFIINLPGSPRAAVENFTVIKSVLGHAVELLHNDPDSEKHH
jgi:molybdenum cofactor synthesis domain-containing protein